MLQALLLCCLGVWASGAAAEISVQDTVVVSARALNDALTPSAAGLVTVIDLSEETGQRDLAEILGRSAGFQVRHYGGLGFAAVPSLRGSAAAQIRIFVDGLPLNDAQSGAVDLSRLPVERFSRVEVHRGMVPTGLGGMGGAGAVNLITRARADGLETDFFTGGFGSLGGRVTWGMANREASRSFLLMAHGRRADNDYQYLDNYQTFATASDDTVRTRLNAWFEEWGLWGSGHWKTGTLGLHATGGWFRKDGGRPGPINYPSESAQVRLDRLDGRVTLVLPGSFSLETASARVEQFLFDPENEIDDGFSGDIRSVSTDLTGRLSWAGALWLSDSNEALLSGLDLTAGLEGRRQWFHQWYAEQEDPLRSRRTSSAFASLSLALFNDRLQITPAWRYQRNADDFPPLPALPWLPEETGAQHFRHDVSPSLGLVWEAAPEELFFEAHAGESVRVPTWVELFGHRGGIDGNRELQPEEIDAADVAVSWHHASGFTSRLAAFVARTQQTIIFIQNSPGTSHAQNIGSTRNRGLEWEGRFPLPQNLHFQGNVTWQRPLDNGEQSQYQGKRLPYLSDLEIDVRFNRLTGSWRPWLEVSFQSGRYRDRFNTELIKAPSRTLWNVGLTRRIGQQMKVSCAVINLTDDQTYDVVQFPLPGRTWQLSVRWNPKLAELK